MAFGGAMGTRAAPDTKRVASQQARHVGSPRSNAVVDRLRRIIHRTRSRRLFDQPALSASDFFEQRRRERQTLF